MSVHDMTSRGWGNDLVLTPNRANECKTATATGWRVGIRAGDHLMLSNANSGFGVSFYLVESIRYFADPPDMWSAAIRWVPIEKCRHLITDTDTLAVLDDESTT